MLLKDKVAIITGAGSGIGKQMATLFTSEGAKVICADISGKEQDVAAELGGVAVNVDVSRSADIQRMIATAEDKFGRLDILCNNAGFPGPHRPITEHTEDNYEKVIDINLKAVFLGMKFGIAAMLRGGGGTVVNTSSVAGLVGMKGHGLYGAAKAGVIQMTKCAALDFADQGIRVNAICPGTTWTGMVPQAASQAAPPPGATMPGTPMNRWGLASEVASAALFLASDLSSLVTGVALPVDGGYVTP